MCGIFGQITPDRTVDADACYWAVEMLSHRGPDGLGIAMGRLADQSAAFFRDPSSSQLRRRRGNGCDFFLGHRRLAVIDLTPEAFQPMSNEDGTIWVVFNGEIYNHRELRDGLTGCGHRFATAHSDTEVLVHGYEQWGERLVERLRGMFALAVLDLRTRRVLLARDRFGEKPLYYSMQGGSLMFASELKALAQLPELDRSVCEDALIDYLNHGWVPAPRSIYRQVRKLRAAERVTVPLDALEKTRSDIYWSPSYEPVSGKSPALWHEEFQAELSESIRLRMISDVPLGAFLSGGLDSTIVTREMSRASERPVSTFSIGFEEPRYDESRYARQVAQTYGTDAHTEVLSAQGLLDVVPQVGAMFDEPFADASAIPTFLVSRLARRSVTVALSGDGGDELLAGYRRYSLQHRLSRLLDPQPDVLVKLLFGPLASLWPQRARGKSLLGLLVPGAKARYFKTFLDDHLVSLSNVAGRSDWQCLLESAWPRGAWSLPDKMCATDCRFYVPEDLMVKVDRASMNVSLESRAPLLDHKLFELVGRMPLQTRFDGTARKLPFRRILAADLGQEFVERPKKGFSIPLGQWFRHELYEELNDTLLGRNGLTTSLMSRGALQKLIANHCTGSRDQSQRLWKLYMLQKWSDCYGKDIPTKPRPVVAPEGQQESEIGAI